MATDKMAAFTDIYAKNYVPAFVKQCAARGLRFNDEAELAHALQLNGKFAAMATTGVSMDTLVNSLISQINVKHATEGDVNLDLRSINAALDSTISSIGIKIASHNTTAAADAVKLAGVTDAELMTFLDMVV